MNNNSGPSLPGVYGGRTEPHPLAAELVHMLREQRLRIAIAESCTGGLVAALLTDVSGASAVFDCGIVSYADSIKRGVLNVAPQTIAAHGAVSRETALAMAAGVAGLAQADIGLSITGIAGPDGGLPEKPVGTVWLGLWWKEKTTAFERHFTGSRMEIRAQAAESALLLVLNAARSGYLSERH